MLSTEIIDRGLNLSQPDRTDPAEYEAFKERYRQEKGHALPAFEFWADNDRFDVLKRYRMQARMTPTEAGLTRPLPNVLAFLHYYAIVGFDDGILYEIKLAQSVGASKDAVLATIAVAFLHGGPRGMRYVATSSMEELRDYVDPMPGTWPEGWTIDPDAFTAGLDYSTPELLPGEQGLIESWYDRVSGEVPTHVAFLARHRPRLLKAHRGRLESTIKDAMPVQMMPYLHLHWNTARGFEDGIREAALMGRGLGMTDEQLSDAISWGALYGGPASLSIAARATHDVLPC